MIGRRALVGSIAAGSAFVSAPAAACSISMDYIPRHRDFAAWRSVIWSFVNALERKDVSQALALMKPTVLMTDDKLHGDITEYRGPSAAGNYFRKLMDRRYPVGLRVQSLVDHAGDVFVFLKENFAFGFSEECGASGAMIDRVYRFRFEDAERKIAALHMTY